MKLVRYRGSRRRTDWEGDEPKASKPFLYILTEPGSELPFYIGECGRGKTYNVLGRIRRHFWETGTLARVAHNLPKFNSDVPAEFDAYVKKLEDSFSNTGKRQSLEAWLIYIICHVEKCQSYKFCVTKYSVPTDDYSEMAEDILAEFRECHKKAMSETRS